MCRRILVISAHTGDFVWRCSGTIAKYASLGWNVKIICLTYGARGESAAFYKNTHGTYEECCEARKQEGIRAANAIKADITYCGYSDFCLDMNQERVNLLADEMLTYKPDLILTHHDGKDLNNPDHTITAKAVLTAYETAMRRGMKYAPVYAFEPMNPEMSGYRADTYIDITDVWDAKKAAMDCLETQKKTQPAYVEKALFRASYASGRGGNKNCRYAETFRRYFPVYQYDDFAV